MAVDIATGPVFRAGMPHPVGPLPDPKRPFPPALWDITADGKFLLASPVRRRVARVHRSAELAIWPEEVSSFVGIPLSDVGPHRRRVIFLLNVFDELRRKVLLRRVTV